MKKLPLVCVGAACVLLAAESQSVAPARCSMIPRGWLRGESVDWVIAVAGRDSAVGAHWTQPGYWAEVQVDSPRTGPVYGQWGVVEAGTDSSIGRRALFITWHLGSLCEPLPSGRALGIAPGMRFFLSATVRRDTRFASGASILDYTATTEFYSPARAQRNRLERVLTVEEFASYYASLPSIEEYHSDPEDGAERVGRWARAHPSLATLTPLLSSRWHARLVNSMSRDAIASTS
mgnify:FL=1